MGNPASIRRIIEIFPSGPVAVSWFLRKGRVAEGYAWLERTAAAHLSPEAAGRVGDERELERRIRLFADEWSREQFPLDGTLWETSFGSSEEPEEWLDFLREGIPYRLQGPAAWCGDPEGVYEGTDLVVAEALDNAYGDVGLTCEVTSRLTAALEAAGLAEATVTVQWMTGHYQENVFLTPVDYEEIRYGDQWETEAIAIARDQWLEAEPLILNMIQFEADWAGREEELRNALKRVTEGISC